MHYNLADAIAASRHYNHLLAPDVRIIAPVVRDCVVEPCAHASQHTQASHDLQALEYATVLRRQCIALGCIAREEDKRQRKGRVERGVGDQARNGVSRYACGPCQQSPCTNYQLANSPSRARVQLLRIGIVMFTSVYNVRGTRSTNNVIASPSSRQLLRARPRSHHSLPCDCCGAPRQPRASRGTRDGLGLVHIDNATTLRLT
jgi:hypothetical protein